MGHCGLLDKEVEGKVEIEINYVLTPAKWGRGYAIEIAAVRDYGFRQCKLQRLIALIGPDNLTSAKVAEKIGMHCTGIIKRGSVMKKSYVVTAEGR